jgi:glycosyltransferase involved in cell wall biosynthesis
MARGGALASRIEAVARAWRPDVLHAHSPALCGLAAVRAGRRLGIPVVYEIRAFWEDAAGQWHRPRGFAPLLADPPAGEPRGGRRRCGGDDLPRPAGGSGGAGVARDRLSIMPNGVDLTVFGQAQPRDPALAEALGLGDGPVIGFLGSFYPYEGLDDLIAAMPAIVAGVPEPAAAGRRRPGGRCPARAGGGFAGGGRDPLRRPRAARRGRPLLRAGRCRVLSAQGHALTDLVTPLKPLEAMAQGKLVAASDVGGHRN